MSISRSVDAMVSLRSLSYSSAKLYIRSEHGRAASKPPRVILLSTLVSM